MPIPLANKRCVTVAKGRPSSSSDECPERDAWVNRAYQMPWLTWGTKCAMWDDSNWSRAEGGEDKLVSPATGAPPPGARAGRRHSWPVQEWRMTFHKLWHPMIPNPPPWKMQSGYHSTLNSWTCQIGGRSSERSLGKMTTGNCMESVSVI